MSENETKTGAWMWILLSSHLQQSKIRFANTQPARLSPRSPMRHCWQLRQSYALGSPATRRETGKIINLPQSINTGTPLAIYKPMSGTPNRAEGGEMTTIEMTIGETRIWDANDESSETMMRRIRQRARDIAARTGQSVEISTSDGIIVDAIPSGDFDGQEG